jgi:hypothetical protein
MTGCSKAPVHDRPEDAAALVKRGLFRAEQGDDRVAIVDYTDALYLRGAARDRAWAGSQPWILTGERSGLLTRIAMGISVSLCVRMTN